MVAGGLITFGLVTFGSTPTLKKHHMKTHSVSGTMQRKIWTSHGDGLWRSRIITNGSSPGYRKKWIRSSHKLTYQVGIAKRCASVFLLASQCSMYVSNKWCVYEMQFCAICQYKYIKHISVWFSFADRNVEIYCMQSDIFFLRSLRSCHNHYGNCTWHLFFRSYANAEKKIACE